MVAENPASVSKPILFNTNGSVLWAPIAALTAVLAAVATAGSSSPEIATFPFVTDSSGCGSEEATQRLLSTPPTTTTVTAFA